MWLTTIAVAAASCGSANQSVTGPSSNKCPVNASAQRTNFEAAGGNGVVTVATNRECQWSASSTSPWIQLNGGSPGQGEGQVAFSVRPNGDPAVRRGAIAINDQQVAIEQAAAVCRFTVSPSSQTVSPAGGRQQIDVTASSPQCAWTARSDQDWLVVVDGSSGSGTGRVTYEARPASGPTRTGSIVVADHRVTITQGNGCSTSVSPASHSVGASGGSVAIAVTSASGCAWSAVTDVAWITVRSGASGSGSGTVMLNVDPWNGPSRTGTVRVGAYIVTITQTAGCSFAIDPGEHNVAAAGGSATVAINTANGCAWTAASPVAWVRFTSPTSGSGSATVQFEVDRNDGPQRSATLTIAGMSHVVTQAGSCSYGIEPASHAVEAAGGSGSIAVTSGDGCAWTAETADGWITIATPPGGSGSGNGTVTYSVDPNSGPARNGSILVAGRSFGIQQADGCEVSLSSPGQAFDQGGGTGSFDVNTGAGCGWTATPGADWITIVSPPGGSGPGRIEFQIGPNAGAARTAAISVGTQSFTVTQTGS